MTPEERFWSKVDKSGECWEWTGHLTKKGYGWGALRGRHGLAHGFAWLITYGQLLPGMQVDHRCLNRSCVRPDHLQAATNQQNGENRAGAYSNSKSGVRGVTPYRDKWMVSATSHGVRHYGGLYVDIRDAEAAAIALRNRIMTNNLLDRHQEIA